MNVRANDSDQAGADGLAHSKTPSATESSDAIERILKFDAIANRPRLIKLLRYIVREEIEGRGERLKGFSIAIDVFERGEDFDPQSDSIVRVEMFRLRHALTEYYSTIGEDDPLRIDVPKGTYRPTFTAPETPEPLTTGGLTPSRKICLRMDIAACAALLLVSAGYMAGRCDCVPDSVSFFQHFDGSTGSGAPAQLMSHVVPH